MKSLFITVLFSIYSCLNSSDPTVNNHTILPSTPEELIEEPDTFIRIETKELDTQRIPELEKSTTSKPLEEITRKGVKEIGNHSEDPQDIIAIPEDLKIHHKQQSIDSNHVIIYKPETPASLSDFDPAKSKTSQDNEAVIDKEKPSADIVPINPSQDRTEVNETEKSSAQVEMAPHPAKADHSVFSTLLSTYVSASGIVNYKGLQSEESKLDMYLSHLGDNAPAANWSKQAALAYWMNAYNAFTIKLILDHYPVAQITDLYDGKPWDRQWINLGGKSYSLNDIEHTIIRPTFKDPRIHFAVNCAAKSCPPLLNKAFTEDNVDRELTKLTQAFVNSSANKLTKSSIQLSKIFEWYADDFGNIIDFLNQYATEKLSSDAKIGYLPYDWALNEA